MKLTIMLAAFATLTGCGQGTACYGLTDKELFEDIQQAYANRPMTPEMARNSRLDRERVIAVERVGAKGEDAFAGMLFLQDDGSILSIRLHEDCGYQTSIVPYASVKNWAYHLAPPRF